MLIALLLGFELTTATLLRAFVHGFWQVVDEVINELPVA